LSDIKLNLSFRYAVKEMNQPIEYKKADVLLSPVCHHPIAGELMATGPDELTEY
jgi:hypothetical protein